MFHLHAKSVPNVYLHFRINRKMSFAVVLMSFDGSEANLGYYVQLIRIVEVSRDQLRCLELPKLTSEMLQGINGCGLDF